MIVTTLGSDEITPDQVLVMEQINVQKMEIQRGAEKCCRTFKMGRLPVSPPVSYLHKLREGFVNLKAWQEKQMTNSHIIHNAHKAGIP